MTWLLNSRSHVLRVIFLSLNVGQDTEEIPNAKFTRFTVKYAPFYSVLSSAFVIGIIIGEIVVVVIVFKESKDDPPEPTNSSRFMLYFCCLGNNGQGGTNI